MFFLPSLTCCSIRNFKIKATLINLIKNTAGPVSWWRWSGPGQLSCLLPGSEIQSKPGQNASETGLCSLPQTSQHLEGDLQSFSLGHSEQACSRCRRGCEKLQCPLQHLQFCAGQAKALRIPCSWEHPGKACLSAELPLGFSHPITQVLLTLRDLLGPCIRAGCSLGHVAKKYFKKNSNTACFHIAPSRCSPLVCVFHFLSPVLVYPKDEVALLEGLGLMLRSVFPGWDC